MKYKSSKLRWLRIMEILIRYSDENHQLDSFKLNDHLRPLGLECSNRVLGDTARTLREYGMDVQISGWGNHYGVFLRDSLIPHETLKQLVCAVSTNPYISRHQANAILAYLRPFVSVYQEDLLKSSVLPDVSAEETEGFYAIFSIVDEAIRQKKRIRYVLKRGNRTPDEDSHRLTRKDGGVRFTPKALFYVKTRLYLFGYDHWKKSPASVPLCDISYVRMMHTNGGVRIDSLLDFLSAFDGRDFVSEDL